jgi:Xaa-Pro aminopeptidase
VSQKDGGRPSREEAGRGRVDALQRELQARDLDVLLVLGSGRHHFIGANFAWWLSGVRNLGRDAAVLLPSEGEPVLIVSPSWDGARAARRGWIEDVVAVDGFEAALVEQVRARGWRGARAAVAGAASASPAVANALPAVFDAPAGEGDPAVLAVASLHDAYAISCIERAVEIAEAGYRHMCEIARPGMKEYELAAEADGHMRELGADDNFLLISASQHNRAVHAPTDRELSLGDIILGEISPSFDGQFAQICRSAIIGEPDDRQVACYEVLREGFHAGLEACGPGVPVREVTRVINDLIGGRGYEQYCKPPYMRTRGHAMGLGAMVPADISASSDVVLEPGMSFVLHPNQYFPEVGYYLCGDQVVVTEDGARALAPAAPHLDAITGAVVA